MQKMTNKNEKKISYVVIFKYLFCTVNGTEMFFIFWKIDVLSTYIQNSISPYGLQLQGVTDTEFNLTQM